MGILERLFLDRSLRFKKLYESTPWWRFKKRMYLKKEWYTSRELMVKYRCN